MRFAGSLHKARKTQAKYVQFIAFPRQQHLHNLTTILRLFVHCPSCFLFVLANRAVNLQ